MKEETQERKGRRNNEKRRKKWKIRKKQEWTEGSGDGRIEKEKI